jgi:hypothetical protein
VEWLYDKAGDTSIFDLASLATAALSAAALSQAISHGALFSVFSLLLLESVRLLDLHMGVRVLDHGASRCVLLFRTAPRRRKSR